MTRVLCLDSSLLGEHSTTRKLTDALLAKLQAQQSIELTRIDLTQVAPPITPEGVIANGTPADQKTPAQNALMAPSDQMIQQLMEADILVIGSPIYNFGPSAFLKNWVDIIARAGLTFQYTQSGPVGLVSDKKTYILVASGGVPVNSPVDFATPWLKQALNFLGIQNIEIIAADGHVQNPSVIDKALDQIEQLSF
jgi:FMN-dependent NADH-azoreductase